MNASANQIQIRLICENCSRVSYSMSKWILMHWYRKKNVLLFFFFGPLYLEKTWNENSVLFKDIIMLYKYLKLVMWTETLLVYDYRCLKESKGYLIYENRPNLLVCYNNQAIIMNCYSLLEFELMNNNTYRHCRWFAALLALL